jgi:hypothetical protein
MPFLPACAIALAFQFPAPNPPWYDTCGWCCFGMVVAAAGDFDKDGCPDMIIGDLGYGTEGVGPAFFIVSVTTGTILQRINFAPEPSCSYHVEGGQDVDADGIPDVLIGIGRWLTGARGCVQLISGANGQLLRSWPADVSWQDQGDWTRFLRDVDGDGVSDVAVLSRFGSSRCTLVVYSSGTGNELLNVPIEAPCGEGPFGVVEVEDGPRGTLGYAVMMDGGPTLHSSVQLFSSKSRSLLWRADGPDLGTYGSLATLRVDGSAYTVAVGYGNCVDILDSRTGDVLHRFLPPGKTDDEWGFGWAVAPLGDIDCDGTADFAFSETESGLSEGTVHANSGQSGRTLWSVTDVAVGDTYRLGYQLAPLSDVDGDGLCDLAAGTWGSKGGAPGRAFVISGKTGTIIREFRRKDDSVYVKRTATVEKPR